MEKTLSYLIKIIKQSQRNESMWVSSDIQLFITVFTSNTLFFLLDLLSTESVNFRLYCISWKWLWQIQLFLLLLIENKHKIFSDTKKQNKQKRTLDDKNYLKLKEFTRKTLKQNFLKDVPIWDNVASETFMGILVKLGSNSVLSLISSVNSSNFLNSNMRFLIFPN